MLSLKQLEAKVDLDQQECDNKYLWFDADTLVYLAALTIVQRDLPIECMEIVLERSYDRLKQKAEESLGHPVVVVSAFSDGNTFRHDILPTYKGNRVDKWKPPLIESLRDIYSSKYLSVYEDKLEADDVVSILHTRYPDHVLCSGDKDLKQLSGQHYNPRTDVSYKITEDEALRFRIYQWICGDTADGYGGCYLIGDKKANALLDEAEVYDREFVQTIIELYDQQNIKAEERGKGFRDPIIMCRVSQILRYPLEEYENLSDPFLLLTTS